MAQVWKFTLAVEDLMMVSMPKGAQILHFATQGAAETPCVWALVDPAAPNVGRVFRLVGTGHKIGMDGDPRYVGTIHVRGGALVFHLFDCGENDR